MEISMCPNVLQKGKETHWNCTYSRELNRDDVPSAFQDSFSASPLHLPEVMLV